MIKAKNQETTDATLEGVTVTIAPNHETVVTTGEDMTVEADTAPPLQIVGDMKDIPHGTADTPHETAVTPVIVAHMNAVATINGAIAPAIEAQAHAIPTGLTRAAGTTRMIPRIVLAAIANLNVEDHHRPEAMTIEATAVPREANEAPRKAENNSEPSRQKTKTAKLLTWTMQR